MNHSEPPQDGLRRDDRGLHELAEDAVGFGMLELRTSWVMLARPAQALDDYMRLGSTAGGTLARPLRLYLLLNAVLMLQLFLSGGVESMFLGAPPPLPPELVAASGKSADAFMADFDGWVSLTVVPIMAAIYALAAAPLLRWWDPERLGWRRGFRAAFVYLNAMTVPFLPVAWLAYDPRLYGYSQVALITVIVVAFLRAGRGRWFRSWFAGALKAVVITSVMLLVGLIGLIPVFAIGAAGATFGP